MSFLSTSSPVPKKYAAPVNAPSPTPSNTSSTGKRKRPEISTPYSQPAQTGTGQHVYTQVTYAVQYLKEKDRPLTLRELILYLSLQGATENERRALESILRGHGSVAYHKDGANGAGTFKYKPKHDVRSAQQLKGYLQKRTTAQGISVNELKDGWPGAVDAINEMEKNGELLVTRHKKDGTPRTVWLNDPSLAQNIDPKFREMWETFKLPQNPDELRDKLEAAGLKPTSAPKKANNVVKAKEKKKKAARRSGKETNKHMAGILRDYSHKRK